MNEKINYQKLFIANIIAGSIGGIWLIIF